MKNDVSLGKRCNFRTLAPVALIFAYCEQRPYFRRFDTTAMHNVHYIVYSPNPRVACHEFGGGMLRLSIRRHWVHQDTVTRGASKGLRGSEIGPSPGIF